MNKTWLLLLTCTLFVACGGDDDDDNQPVGGASPSPTATPTPSADPIPTASPTPDVCFGMTVQDLTGCEGAAVDATWDSVLEAGLTVETFTQQLNDETVTRRYLQYIPENLDHTQPAPLVFILHGANINAEITREFDTHADLEAIADEQGFVVIYGNALGPVPAPTDDKFFANSGIWGSVDGVNLDEATLDNDFAYLLTILENVENEGVQLNEEAIFIGGISNGALMTLAAVENLAPTFRAGFAGVPAPIQFTSTEIDVSMMFYYSDNDPAFAPFFQNSGTTYAAFIGQTIGAWALAIGIDEDTVNNPVFTPMMDSVVEGESYSGTAPIAVNSTNSTLEEVRAMSADGENEVWVIHSERAGHAIPHPIQFDIGTVEGSTGFRNQDANSIKLMWQFFSQFVD